ncbi:major facilitator superfamily domain-containing protein [Aspergillus welwitschiae]|uniref:Major facilitator superfamily domain-containing protein n=1 Tax=Aspergillus welwitschiae TaxID=1341132 RepID=A0A3F3PMC0_9EURO|nr:major facilitator superfamily domain-containing protein [Aspergillus welwitschiae]RDH28080.1 major facilitator superfamily domain-containing protein [Aspergillus welwitschiae]
MDTVEVPTSVARISECRSHRKVFWSKPVILLKPVPNPRAPSTRPGPLLVDLAQDKDRTQPQNWSTGRKLLIVLILCYVTFVAAFASAAFSTTIQSLEHEFHIDAETGTLGATLVFTTATTTTKDAQSVLITHFFAGLFSASPVATVPACFADLYDTYHCGMALTMFSMAVFAGPFTSPLVGGYIILNPDLGWRWTMYIVAIMGLFGTILLVIFHRKNFPLVILVHQARRLRKQTGIWELHACHEEQEPSLQELVARNLARPIRLLFTQPIVLLFTLYMSFVYGLMYALLGDFPVIFQTIHGMNMQNGGVAFYCPNDQGTPRRRIGAVLATQV